MDFGEAKFVRTQNKHSKQVLIVGCERNPGFMLKFHKRSKSEFECASCKRLGKCRAVTVKNGRIVGRKHHADCQPIAAESIEYIINLDK
jgi:hypothetical protein